MNRGRRSEVIFSGKEDFQIFIALLEESAEMWNIRISAYCLMPNYYHLLLQTPDGNISRGMRHINGGMCILRFPAGWFEENTKGGMFNEPRNAAVYLMRKIRRDRLKEIGELFGIGKYSSVSSMIEGTKQRMKTDRSFRKRINDLYRSIINSQKQTWPLFNLVFSAWSALVWWYQQSV